MPYGTFRGTFSPHGKFRLRRNVVKVRLSAFDLARALGLPEGARVTWARTDGGSTELTVEHDGLPLIQHGTRIPTVTLEQARRAR